MSAMLRGSLLIAATTVAVLGLAVGVTLAVRPEPEPRELVLVARGMAFYVNGDPSPNPTIQLRPGEHVRFVLRNEAAGFTHDLSIPALDLTIEPVESGAMRSVSIRVPHLSGAYPYVCRPHAQMMKGTVAVSGS
jgi:plastocyanin